MQFGIHGANPSWMNRNIRVSNNLAIFLGSIFSLFALTHVILHPSESKVLYGHAFALVVVLTIPYINKHINNKVGRTLLTLDILIALMLFTMLRKFSVDPENLISSYTFYLPRLFLLIFTVLTFSYIHYSEKALMIGNILIGLLTLMLFDPLHNLLGIGYYQLGFEDADYYYTNVLFFFLFVIIVASVGIFKIQVDNYVTKNEELVVTLSAKNELIESQREEIKAQNDALQTQNYSLESAVENRTTELQQQFLQLEQFSFITAHNLRGPVARILGLTTIIDHSSITNPTTSEAINHLEKTAHDLDEIICDLGTILSIQKGKTPKKLDITLDAFIRKIEDRHKSQLVEYGFVIHKSLLTNSIKSIPAYLDSIMTNLLTNSIKYRSSDTNNDISITIKAYAHGYKILFKDNGVGFNSEKYTNKLFQPFQRFNLYHDGKGLGLFLIKTQVTTLLGEVSLRSKEGNGTEVEIFLPL